MKYRILGKTGLKVSEIGYGTWQFANDKNCWIGATRKESERALLSAIDSGVNFIDTARAYGDGLSEQWIGEIITKRSRANLVIASKVYPKNWQWPARQGVDIQEVFPRQHIIDQVEASLRTLDRDYLDLMQFHVWQDNWVNQNEWKQTIQKLTQEGKVKYWGISTNNHESTNCIKTCQTGLINVIQTIFNLFYQEPIESLFTFVKTNNIGLIARVPLDEGGLTGNITAQTTFSKGDFRRNYFGGRRLQQLDQRITQLKQYLTRDVQSLAELSLRFILSFDEVSTVIPGMRQPKHVIENISLSHKQKFSQDLLKNLSHHAWNRNFYEP